MYKLAFYLPDSQSVAKKKKKGHALSKCSRRGLLLRENFLQRHISRDSWSLGIRGEELWSPEQGAYPFKVYVFEVESVDVAREEAVSFSRVSPRHTSRKKGRKKVSKRLTQGP